MTKTVVGIDPGKTGGMVILYPDDSMTCLAVPMQKVNGKPKPAWQEWGRTWSDALREAEPDMIVIENVAARPGQGVTSMFSFGVTLGFVQGLCAAAVNASTFHPTPGAWKAKLGLLKADKNASRETARRILPAIAKHVERVKDDGIAEAALLAYYGRKYL